MIHNADLESEINDLREQLADYETIKSENEFYKNYLEIKEIVAVGGTWLGKSSDIEAGNWDAIRKAVTDAVALKKSL